MTKVEVNTLHYVRKCSTWVASSPDHVKPNKNIVTDIQRCAFTVTNVMDVSGVISGDF